MSDALRGLPAVHRLLEHESIAPYESLVGRSALRAAIASELDRARAQPIVPPIDLLASHIAERLEIELAENLCPVVNATGTLLHTNLGRAPLASAALAAARDIGAGYSNIEYDVIAGERGSRYRRLTGLLREATGAQDGLVVNNCAAAVLLILDTFARGAEVIAARNQLIEIGGGFRLPDVLARSGAKLVEVGTANRVYLSDFSAALSPRTALLMRSHPSNYSIEGFVSDVEPNELVRLGARAGVPVVEDLGSGALVDLTEYGLPHERTVQEAVRDGVSLVAFSGDKLLGGPQAGIIVGSPSKIARLRSNPLLRALRIDKITIALLAATLELYRSKASREQIPIYAMLALPLESLAERAATYVAALPHAMVRESTARVGGGTLPASTLPSLAVTLPAHHPERLAARLRAGRIPIVARVESGAVVLDLRSIAPAQDAFVISAAARIA
ncbi:MAG: L-seryl-tRNA(Sec) selenium transferase [Candidatus Eremiobacteraeota bacterium]|nr:L-seryl-tRNA(Sec) selenium transferase [Candidatus Eremiobacteraeota bacterium]